MRKMEMRWAADLFATGNHPCAVCGKQIKNSETARVVHVIDGGANILHPADEHLYQEDGGELGWHEIGPECAKQFGAFALTQKQYRAASVQAVNHEGKRPEEPTMSQTTYSTKSNAKAGARKAGVTDPILIEVEGGRFAWSPRNTETRAAKKLDAEPTIEDGDVEVTFEEYGEAEVTAEVPEARPEPTVTTEMEEAFSMGNLKAKGEPRQPVTEPVQAPKAKTVRPGTKAELVANLLTRPEGCTTADILAATGWPAVSVPQQARSAGLTLRKEKDGKTSRYYGTAE